MKITSAEFIKSAFSEPDWPQYPLLPEIAFLGRSNVGKSSLINSLLGVRGLARTSSTPGRTQSLNFFLVNQNSRFVDLPGYGFAQAPQAVKATWGQMATDYLAKRTELVLSIHIVDSRHEPTKSDAQLRGWLQHYAKRRLTVATKSDKLSQNQLRKNIERIRCVLEEAEVIAYSALTGQGRNKVWKIIQEALSSFAPPVATKD